MKFYQKKSSFRSAAGKFMYMISDYFRRLPIANKNVRKHPATIVNRDLRRSSLLYIYIYMYKSGLESDVSSEKQTIYSAIFVT